MGVVRNWNSLKHFTKRPMMCLSIMYYGLLYILQSDSFSYFLSNLETDKIYWGGSSKTGNYWHLEKIHVMVNSVWTLLLKGQLISKCPFGVIVWTKKPTKFICPSLEKEVKSKKLQIHSKKFHETNRVDWWVLQMKISSLRWPWWQKIKYKQRVSYLVMD